MSEKKRGGCCSWILIPLVAILLFAMIDSCSSDPVTSGTPSTVYTTTTTTTVSTTTVTGSSTTTKTTTARVTTTTTAKQATFNDLVSLSRYLQAEVRAGNLKPSFTYTGDQSKISGELIAQMLATYCVSYSSQNVSGGKRYTVTVTDYPGDRIVKAYRSGNTSTLTAAEKQVLTKAEKIVSSAKAQAKTRIELELALAKWMFDNVTYVNCDTAVGDLSQINRPLTAFGSLMDGSANCQGYTDGFYVLASLAGFEVDRQYMPGHVTSTICLDGKWYVVDITHCDASMSLQDNLPCYYLFNSGKDRLPTYSWDTVLNRRPIEATSSSDYYYNLPADGSAHGYKKTFGNATEAGKALVQQYQAGYHTQHVMITQKNVDVQSLHKAINAAADSAGVRVSYTTWHNHLGNLSYFYVQFK